EDRLAARRWPAEEAVDRDRERLVQGRDLVRERLRDRVQHRAVDDDLVRPAAAEALRVAEQEAGRADAGAEVLADLPEPGGALLAARLDAADGAVERRIDGDAGAEGDVARGSGFGDDADDLVAEVHRQ